MAEPANTKSYIHPIQDHLFSSNRVDQDLVALFFMFFARCEYALKSSGFILEAKGGSGRYQIDWDRFATELPDTFFSNMDTSVSLAMTFRNRSPG